MPRLRPSRLSSRRFSLNALDRHFQSLPATVTDRQNTGFSKLAAISVHDSPTAILPAIPAEHVKQWVSASAPFTHTVNTDSVSLVPQWTFQQFCQSALTAGHILIDLFGLSKPLCEALMLHYKLLKAQSPALSAHFVVPSVKHTYQSGLIKPAGLMMQTVQQFKRGRRKAVVIYNPPVVQRRDAMGNSAAGLSSLFKVCLAGTPARALVDTGAEISFMNSAFAKRAGFSIKASSSPPSIQVANGQHLHTSGHVTVPMRLPGFTGKFDALVADLSHLPCDILLGDAWLRSQKGCLTFGPEGVASLAISKGSTKVILKPMTSSAISTLQLNALQMRRQLKPGRVLKCFAVKVTSSAQSSASVVAAAEKQDPDLVDPSVIEALKLEFKDVFAPPPDGLPPDRGTRLLIPLLPDHKPPYRNPYRLSPLEIAEVKKQIEELLKKGWIEESQSPYGSSILFVTKKDGSLRMCIDYRSLNNLTVKDRSPLPRIDDLLSQMNGAKVFSSLDLAQGYHQIRIADEDVPKTGFTTPYGHYQFKVMCFGLSNAPGTFQRVMNRLFSKQMHKYVVIYLDDILIFSKSPEEHVQHLKEVLSILRKHKLFAKMSKCDLNMSQVLYLGHIVSRDGLSVDPKKVATVQDWPVPKDLHELRCFLGLTNYFRTFVQGYATRVLPLTRLQSPKREFLWDNKCQEAFDGIKHDLTHAPVLKSPDLSQPFELVTDACDAGIGAVLLQDRRPVAFESRKLIPAEQNYTTTEKECLAVIHALKVWRCYLEGQPKERLTIVTDHNPLIHLPKQPTLSRRIARWSEYLQRFNFTWQYRPGRINVADPVSRRPADEYPVISVNVTTRSSRNAPSPIAPESSSAVDMDIDQSSHHGSQASSFRADIVQGYAQDPWFVDAENVSELEERQGLYFQQNAVVIPNHADLRASLMHEYHNTPFSGHQGYHRTAKLLEKDYWWPTLRSDVLSHVKTCGTCQRNKGATKRPFGEAQPLPVPDHQWKDISMDFITHLPPTRSGYTSIMVVVDRLTKMVHFLPTFDSVSAEDVAALFRDRVFCLHGMPQSIVSDRDVKFTSAFWQELHRLLDVKLNLSTAYHPQTDGQTERMNRVLEDMLRHFVNRHHDDWDQFLATAEFAINNAENSSVQNTPFMLNYGRHPLVPANMQEHLRDAKLWQKHERVPAANIFIDKISKAISLAKQAMHQARERQLQILSGKSRPHPFEPGQRVLLSSKNVKLRSSGTPKLQPRWLGPFKLIKLVGSQAAELELPSTMKIHDVFHVSLLKPFHSQPGEVANPPVVYVDGDQEFDVEYIRRHRGSKRNQEYLVHWTGYPPAYDSWEPAAALRNCPAVVKEYWAKQQLSADHA